MNEVSNINKFFKWIGSLQNIKRYNNSKQRIISLKPNEVNKGNEKALLDTVLFIYVPPDFVTNSKFEIGFK